MGLTPAFLLPREKAEQAIWNRLRHLKALKARRHQDRPPLRIGILGTWWAVRRWGARAVVPHPITLRFLSPLVASGLFRGVKAGSEGVRQADRGWARPHKDPCPLVAGCMAERLKEEILHREKLVDIVAGPDAYRDLPRLLAVAESGQQAANVLLSLDETYADILPVQTSAGGTTAFV